MKRIVDTLLALLLAASAAASCYVLLRSRAPASDAAVAPKVRHARLLFTGDLMQHLPQVKAASRGEGFDYSMSLAAVAPLFHGADLAVVNLETTLRPEPPYTGYPCFRSPEVLADALADAGVDVALLANNHCCDGGGSGIGYTVAALERAGIAHTGVFRDSADYARNRVLRIERGGIRFALLNYTYGTNGLSVPEGRIVHRLDTLLMARDLKAAKDEASDCIVVCVHWGEEYARRPGIAQRTVARFLRRHGADLIVGSHPHVVQSFEGDEGGFTLYSLGNFVSNQRKRYCDGGLVAEVEVRIHTDGRTEYALDLVPVWVLCPFYRILTPEAADTVRMAPEERRRYEEFLDDTHEALFGLH